MSEIQFSPSAQGCRDGKLPLDFSFKLLSKLAESGEGGKPETDVFHLHFFNFNLSGMYRYCLDQNCHEQHKAVPFAELEQNLGRTLPTFAGFCEMSCIN